MPKPEGPGSAGSCFAAQVLSMSSVQNVTDVSRTDPWKFGGKGGINTRGASHCFLKRSENLANFHTSRNTNKKRPRLHGGRPGPFLHGSSRIVTTASMYRESGRIRSCDHTLYSST